jgi:hypothetical protein
MVNQTKDRTLCDKTISSHAIATHVFLFEWNHHRYAHPPTKKAKVTVEYKCGTCVTTNKCTDVRMSLGMQSGIYCRMCYRKQLTTELSPKERRKTCRTSAMGCPICKEPICKECWKEGYDKHAYFYLRTKCLASYPTDHTTLSPAVTWEPMVRFAWLNMQHGLAGHSRSILHLGSCWSDHCRLTYVH